MGCIRVNDSGLAILKRYERCSLVAYWDVNGWSIGWGCHNHPGVDKSTVWTQEQCDSQLVADIENVEAELDHLITAPLTSNQWSALVDFAYNEGAGNLQHSSLLRFVNDADYVSAAAEFKNWRLVNGQPSAQLEARRHEEEILFTTPDSP